MVTTRFITEGARTFLPQDLFVTQKESINNDIISHGIGKIWYNDHYQNQRKRI